MSLLPTFALADLDIGTSEAIKSPPREYSIDFQTGELTGEIVEGLEAIKVWCYMTLHCERYRHTIYSWQYGVELEQYFGHVYSPEYLASALKKDICSALLQNEFIKDISDFEASMEHDTLRMNFTVKTDYGEVQINV